MRIPRSEPSVHAIGTGRDTARAVSQRDIDTVKTLFAAFADRDFEAAAGILDPSLEIRPAIVGGPEGAVYRGPDGMRRFWDDVDDAWAEFRIEAEEFRELDGAILVLGRALARGRESEIALEVESAWIARLRNGRIVHFQSFSNKQEAIEAAGLADQS